jgi:hypothetical protein
MRPFVVLVIGVVFGLIIGFGAGRVTAPDDKAPPTTTTAPTTTTIVRPSFDITPTSGPIGTTFTFTVHGFRPGTGVIFEVDFPDGKIFKGLSHPVGPDGSASATYKATTGNATGTYTVHASDQQGTSAQAQFVVGSVSASSTATTTTRTTG